MGIDWSRKQKMKMRIQNMTEKEQKIDAPMDQNNTIGCNKMISISRSIIRPHMWRGYKDAYTNSYDATPISQYPISKY